MGLHLLVVVRLYSNASCAQADLCSCIVRDLMTFSIVSRGLGALQAQACKVGLQGSQGAPLP